MRDVLPTLQRWADAGDKFALATVVRTWGSSPRAVGSVMGVRADGATCGSVSGGCIESAVIEDALQAMSAGEPRRLHFAHITDEMAWEVGLSCGGEVDVWIDCLPNALLWDELAAKLARDEPCVLATRYEPYCQILWTPGQDGTEIQAAYDARRSQEVEIDGKKWFCNVLSCRDRLVIIGAVHIAQSLVGFAKAVGFETVVIDPRTAFAQNERFKTEPDKMIAKWPKEALESVAINEDTYAVVLTHDPKIDDAALETLLRSPVAYIGALGSRTTQAKRRNSLAAKGFTAEELDRIRGPVGLKIGANSPEEIALSIIAEIVQVKRSRG